MSRFAFVQYYYSDVVHKVLEIVEADEKPTYYPNGVNGHWVDITNNTAVQVGWKASTVNFVDWVFSELTYQDHADEATAKKLELLSAAVNWLKLNPLQYSIDLGVATPEEEALLLAYKQFYVGVARVEKQSGYPYTINWPVAPF
ncbi:MULTISPECIES: tail fiber assembly protein [Pseudomonas]|uniref:tail fiber assembly protein n=1 Tax=Pseudomonas TaxID=286 RepID=UPI001473E2A4|nr:MULTISPECIES: tail fiber assembly protein [Pseudomonas]NNA55401.1 tail fiber assembly protein [Pseudomonas koreensis]